MLNELVAKVFADRNAAQLAHWKTGNGEYHRALGEFYVKVIEVTDRLVECSIAAFGVLDSIKLEKHIEQELADRLSDTVVWLCENKEAIDKGVPALDNIIAELCELYLHTVYKLRNLQ